MAVTLFLRDPDSTGRPFGAPVAASHPPSGARFRPLATQDRDGLYGALNANRASAIGRQLRHWVEIWDDPGSQIETSVTCCCRPECDHVEPRQRRPYIQHGHRPLRHAACANSSRTQRFGHVPVPSLRLRRMLSPDSRITRGNQPRNRSQVSACGVSVIPVDHRPYPFLRLVCRDRRGAAVAGAAEQFGALSPVCVGQRITRHGASPSAPEMYPNSTNLAGADRARADPVRIPSTARVFGARFTTQFLSLHSSQHLNE